MIACGRRRTCEPSGLPIPTYKFHTNSTHKAGHSRLGTERELRACLSRLKWGCVGRREHGQRLTLWDDGVKQRARSWDDDGTPNHDGRYNTKPRATPCDGWQWGLWQPSSATQAQIEKVGHTKKKKNAHLPPCVASDEVAQPRPWPGRSEDGQEVRGFGVDPCPPHRGLGTVELREAIVGPLSHPVPDASVSGAMILSRVHEVSGSTMWGKQRGESGHGTGDTAHSPVSWRGVWLWKDPGMWLDTGLRRGTPMWTPAPNQRVACKIRLDRSKGGGERRQDRDQGLPQHGAWWDTAFDGTQGCGKTRGCGDQHLRQRSSHRSSLSAEK